MKDMKFGLGLSSGVLTAVVTTVLSTASVGHAADLNGDGVIDGTDQAILLTSWGPCKACPADLNGDGVVDGVDLAIWMSPPADSGTGDGDTVDDGGLYGPGDGDDSPPQDGGADSGSDGSGSGDPMGDWAQVHAVPLPAPAWITLGGLLGAAYLRRRFVGR